MIWDELKDRQSANSFLQISCGIRHILLDMIISTETNGFSNEKEALERGLRGGYYGGYFEHHVIRDMSYGVWTDARHVYGSGGGPVTNSKPRAYPPGYTGHEDVSPANRPTKPIRYPENVGV